MAPTPEAPIAKEVAGYLAREHSYGNKVTGRTLESHFGGIGYGWELESLWLVLAIGVTFLIAGIVGRSRGLLIPGGIVSGVGAGIVAIEKLGASLVEPGEGGLFLLVFSLGWLLISVMSLFIPEEDGSRDFMWWPLIPGGIMAAIGGLLFAGSTGLTVLTWIGQGWPVILIGIGLYLLLRRKELKDEE